MDGAVAWDFHTIQTAKGIVDRNFFCKLKSESFGNPWSFSWKSKSHSLWPSNFFIYVTIDHRKLKTYCRHSKIKGCCRCVGGCWSTFVNVRAASMWECLHLYSGGGPFGRAASDRHDQECFEKNFSFKVVILDHSFFIRLPRASVCKSESSVFYIPSPFNLDNNNFSKKNCFPLVRA